MDNLTEDEEEHKDQEIWMTRDYIWTAYTLDDEMALELAWI